jgi:hypothetical protein
MLLRSPRPGGSHRRSPAGQSLCRTPIGRDPKRLTLCQRVQIAARAQGLRDRRNPNRRAGHLRRRARLLHPRGRDLRRATNRPERQPRDVSRRVSKSCSRRSRGALLAPGQVLHDPAGGAVSRLYLEGNHWCRRRSGCRSNAGSRSRAAPSAPSSSWRNTASAA